MCLGRGAEGADALGDRGPDNIQLHRGSRWRDALLLTAVFGGFGALHSRDETARGVGIGLIFLGYAVGHLSPGSEFQERAELEKAIWLYNRDVAAGR